MQDMISRIWTRIIRDRLTMFPAVAIFGPRQCGKTTLARQFDAAYFDMETGGSEKRLDADWEVLAAGEKLVIIDEAHRAPWVFPRLRGTIDERRKRNGRFLLLGSVSPFLMRNVSESLAGRISFVDMTPLILPELRAGQLDDLWLRGGYPDGGILDPKTFPRWQHDYLRALAARDLPAWGLPSKPEQTQRLMAMLAAAHAQPLNASQLATSLALDHKTVLSYCDFLEGAFLVRRLCPYLTNVRKRLTKAPRLYWRDSGLLHVLLNVSDFDQLYGQPWVGHSWEGFVIEQTIATMAALEKQAQPLYFRTSDGYELDLVLDWGSSRWAVEIKLTSDPSSDTIDRLNKTADMIDAERRILICRIAKPFGNEKLLVTDLPGWLKTLSE